MFCVDFYFIDKLCFCEQLLLLVCELVCCVFVVQQFMLILVCDFEQVEVVDELLWVFDEDVFILYQFVGDDDDVDIVVLIVLLGIDIVDWLLVINLCEGCVFGCFECVLEVVVVDLVECDGLCMCWCEYVWFGF